MYFCTELALIDAMRSAYMLNGSFNIREDAKA